MIKDDQTFYYMPMQQGASSVPYPHLDHGDGSYKALYDVLERAYGRAASSKGKERHANGKPFTEQPILTIPAIVGPGFNLGQAIKKIDESQRMDTPAAVKELLDAIVYLASVVIFREQQQPF